MQEYNGRNITVNKAMAPGTGGPDRRRGGGGDFRGGRGGGGFRGGRGGRGGFGGGSRSGPYERRRDD